MNINPTSILNPDEQLDIYLAQKQNDEKLKVFIGSCEKNNEPDYELLRKHIEVWTQTHPREMYEFFVLKKERQSEFKEDTGANDDGTMRLAFEMPEGLYHLLKHLSPNFIGSRELTPEGKRKKLRTFLKKFPVFQMPKKI